MGGFPNNSQIEIFLANWEVVFLNFLIEFLLFVTIATEMRLNAQNQFFFFFFFL